MVRLDLEIGGRVDRPVAGTELEMQLRVVDVTGSTHSGDRLATLHFGADPDQQRLIVGVDGREPPGWAISSMLP